MPRRATETPFMARSISLTKNSPRILDKVPLYESDDKNDLLMVLSWQFARENVLDEQECQLANSMLSDEEANAHRVIIKERAPRKAIDWLNRVIDRFNLTNTRRRISQKVRRVKMARLHGWRAWEIYPKIITKTDLEQLNELVSNSLFLRPSEYALKL
jgi:hypothetical protein